MNEISFEELFSAPKVSRLGVVGSREWPDEDFVHQQIEHALSVWPSITTIVSGGANGVDTYAKDFAEARGLLYEEMTPAHQYPRDDARYRPYHVSNFFRRNSDIVFRSHAILAFCYEGSGGTMDTYTKAQKHLDRDRVLLFTERHLSE